ncbi:MAG: VWA domain-containing protein, partial [Syntrophomonadaceae bacterium]|nr:VWA domain-containing protein [Syntrophomonadaceae bacterium]
QDGQIFENEEIIPDVQLGSVVSGIDYLVQDLPEGISFMDSNPELLTIQAGDNLITLNYQELPWLEEEELPEGIEESPGQLGEDEMEPYFSDIRLDFSSLSAPVSKGARMMMRSAPNTTVLQPGEVQAVKTAEWEDYENRIAKIALNVVGEPVLIGADVVLVVDNSGSMGNNSGKVEDHTGTIESPQLINDETSTNIWGTKQTQTRTYSGICQECGKTVTYTSERTRTRPAAWNDWGPWSDWSTPNTTHSVYRIDIAKQASASFVGTVLGDGNPAGNQVALVTFSSSGNSNHLQGVDFQTTVAALAPSINAMNAVGGTNYTDALTKAKSYLDARSDTTRPAYVVFVSDGAPGQSGNSPNDPDWNGINQANALKEAGVTIYSVGIALSQDNAAALTALATVENGVPLYKNVVNVGDLTAVLNKIGGAIQNAGTAALMTDEINIAHFELLSGTPGYLLPEGVTIDNSGGQVKVNWNIGAITKTPQEIVLYVKLKDEYASTGNSYLTNADVNLTYKDTENQPQTKVKEEIGDPSVVVNHIVTFIAGTNGNLATGDQTVFSNILDGTPWDDAVNLPDTEPDPGYKFDSWSPDFPATVTESATYTANFIPADDTAYKVEHYQQDLGATTYTLADTDNLTGTTGENTAAAAKVYPGFTAQSFSQEVIAGDGSTVVKIYYDRNGYTVTWVDEDGTELEKDEDVLYGTTPSYDGAVPSKPA